MELISVIIPVYDVEKYLDECVSSVVNQTYRQLEIILVDDGSPDKCPEMCDDWAKKDSRIKVIHKANGGLSDARNTGIIASSGTYIGFVDSDDYIAYNMYEKLINNLEENNSDISACGVEMFWDDSEKKELLTCRGSYCLKNREAVYSVLKEDKLKQPVWYKLYKRNCIDGVQFPVGKHHEDVFWTYKAVAKAEKVSIFDDVCYFYRQRKNSIMGQNFSEKRLDSIEAKIERIDFLKKNYPEFVSDAKCDYCFSCMYMMQLSTVNKDNNNIRKKIIEFRKQVSLSRQDLKILKIKQRIFVLLSRISFYGCCKLRNILKIGQ